MKKLLCLLAIFAISSIASAAPRTDWPELSKGSYLVPSSIARFGNTIHFAIAQQAAQPDKWIIGWRWAHCQRNWVSDLTAFYLSQSDQSAQDAYERALQWVDRGFKLSIDFQKYESLPFGEGLAMRKQLAPYCKTAQQSVEQTELPIAGTSRRIGRDGYTDYLILKTIVKRGDLTEGWMRRRAIAVEQIKGANGEILKGPDSSPLTQEVFTSQDTLARFKVSANCAQRMIALSRFVEYDKDGALIHSGSVDEKLQFLEPIPGTLGESYLEVLCRM